MPPRAPSPLAIAKQQAKASLDRAKEADTVMAPILARLYAETLFVTKGAPAPSACEMWRRVRIASDVLWDRRTNWPLHIG
jgi:hypothetical protein